MTVAVWVGYPDRLKPMETEWRGSPVSGGTYPASIWRQFMLSTRALFQQKLEKQCTEEDAKKTEKCRAAGLGDVPTTTTPVPAPGTATTPSDTATPDTGTEDQADAGRRWRRADDVDAHADAHPHAGDAGTARAGDADPGAADAADAGSRGRRGAVRRRRHARHGLTPYTTSRRRSSSAASPANAARDATSRPTAWAVPPSGPL